MLRMLHLQIFIIWEIGGWVSWIYSILAEPEAIVSRELSSRLELFSLSFFLPVLYLK